VVLAAAGYNPAKLLAWFYGAWIKRAVKRRHTGNWNATFRRGCSITGVINLILQDTM